MEAQAEKVYVFIEGDPHDGFRTLKWVLKKWSSQPISIVILHAANPKDYVYTYFGKLPASSVSDAKLELLRKSGQEKINKTLLDYKEFCGKVKTEILNVERYDEPIHKIIVELISGLRITKLVMGISFVKSSSWKSRGVSSASYHVHRQKPDFCELFIICEGKLVLVREENGEGFIEDGQGTMVAKVREKVRFKGWLGKMFPENGSFSEKSPRGSPSSSTINDLPGQWAKNAGEIENYFQLLLSSNSDEDGEVAHDVLQNSTTEPDIPANMVCPTNGFPFLLQLFLTLEALDSDRIPPWPAAEKIAALKIKLGKTQEAIQMKRKEVKENVERHIKAEWAICLCTSRAEELEAQISEERTNRIGLEKDLYTAKEELHEIQSEVVERKSKLNSILELQQELSNKLQSLSSAKSHAEVQLEKAVRTRAGMVQEIEEFRQQRDVVQRRIEFCKEKDAIGEAARSGDLGFNYREFTADEIRVATDDFSERLRVKSAGDLTNVYKGRMKHIAVAIKLFDSANGLSQEAFQAKVKLLSHIRHPHIVAVLGFCSELRCIVYEYMHNGCLRDTIFPAQRSSGRRNRGLNWHTRIRIAAEVCSGLGFLHLAQPRPIAHGNLNSSKILIDRNNAAKIHNFGEGWLYDKVDMSSDVRAFGSLLLQLLTGRDRAGLVEEVILMDQASLTTVLDHMAGEWPLDLAMHLLRIARWCLFPDDWLDTELSMATVMREIDKLRKEADDLVSSGEHAAMAAEGSVDMEDSVNVVPSVFFCPILQDVMKNPHIAADGFSYELEAIKEWLGTGHDTSPMTNLKLKHKQLTPNHTLRTLIQDWRNKRLIVVT
ncbi:hypothetical protein RJ639_022576 [Escallonia herrerae]|uniref:RING-type E3 ubiquitin transferase n=1 Tax=Escallonia herrerae TaxID=1293975 RepID=A0AA88V3F9_9ASTE|nr:hypothetical protein RJ639_022576 [Escallonia herrerae]